MKPETTYYPYQPSVYPGEYEPPQWASKKLMDRCEKECDTHSARPMKLREFIDCYLVDMAAPGLSREDFFIYSVQKKLTIIAIKHQDRDLKGRNTLRCQYSKNEIVLPENIDPDFVSANYKNGKLTIFFFKTGRPQKSSDYQIIVY